MSLKKLYKNHYSAIEKEYEAEDNIKKFILEELQKEQDVLDICVDKSLDIKISEDEFSIYYEFGNVYFHELKKLTELFNRHGFELYCISDSYSRKDKDRGLFFMFRVNENEN